MCIIGGQYKIMTPRKSINGRQIFVSDKIDTRANSIITIVSLNEKNQIVKTREIEFLEIRMRIVFFVIMTISFVLTSSCENPIAKRSNDKRRSAGIQTQDLSLDWSGLKDKYESKLEFKDLD